MCAHDHTDPEIKALSLEGFTARATDERVAALTESSASADEDYCAAMSPLTFDHEAAERAADRIADAYRGTAEALARGEISDAFALRPALAHVTAMPFTRLIAYWRETGLATETLFEVIDLCREHRELYFRSEAAPRSQLRAVAPSALPEADVRDLTASHLRDVLLRTVQTVDAVYALLDEGQKQALDEIYRRETQHGS